MWPVLLFGIIGLANAQTQCHTTCTAQYKPVCGTDRHTYSNICRLNVAICYAKLKGTSLHLAHTGRCGAPVVTYRPPTYSCHDICDEEPRTVCGTDAKTYHNMCFLNLANCDAVKSGGSVKVAHYGECRDNEALCQTKCDDTMEPVCSSGNMTFKNACWLNLYGCKYASNQLVSDRYHLAHNGSCDGTDPFVGGKELDCSVYMVQGSVAVEGGQTGHTFKQCGREHEYLCGPDHRTYSGPCTLCRAMDHLKHLDENNMVHIIDDSACRTWIG